VPESQVPLVVQDKIPNSSLYQAGSAAAGNTLPVGVTAYTILYSTNGGVSWLTAEPNPATSVTDLQWWLNQPLATSAWVTVSFTVSVRIYTNATALVANTGYLSYGMASKRPPPAPCCWATII
jgi:hypothetical protein